MEFKCLQCGLLAVLVLYMASVVKTEMFTALADLENLLYAEKGVADDLKSYIKEEEARLEGLKRIAEDYDKHSSESLKDIHASLGNPVNAFLLVKRFTSDWGKVTSMLRNNTSEDFFQSINEKTAYFPSNEDLIGAATALLRIQDTYALSSSKIAKGDLQGVKWSPEMTVEDCFEMGRIAYNEGDYYHTILWMEQALEHLGKDPHENIDKTMLLDYLSYSVYMQGNTRHALNLTVEWLTIDPNHMRAQNNKKYYIKMLEEEEANARSKGDEGEATDKQEFQNKRILDDYRQSTEFRTYEALCRGEHTNKNYPWHKLTCQYKSHHPFYKIRPLREETMYHDPWIVIYHDLMTDEEVETIKRIAQPRLMRATARNHLTGKFEPADYRTSKSAWLRDEEDWRIARVSKKINFMSNLTLLTAEELQVVNYGIGGHYEPHYDFARENELSTFENHRGNRIATVIFYMTDVEAGGATVFPNIGVKLWPTKGACAVWYNLKANGEGDYMTRHAACPVLTGSKWVCNKWIHERGQEFTRPCSLNPDI